jgi:hypothetical protein
MTGFRSAMIGLGLAATAAAAPGLASAQAVDEVALVQPVAQTVVDLAGWVIASGDNGGMPFAVIDKGAAQVLVFGEDGRLKGMAPVLLGSAFGDHSTPGVGDRELSDIRPDERTTPAGRFIAAYGPATGGKTVLWVDNATAISLHPVVTTKRNEARDVRLSSVTPYDNRITYGCINVSPTFYREVVRPTFTGTSGVFYVLPEVAPIEQALPAFAAQRHAATRDRFGLRRASRQGRASH